MYYFHYQDFDMHDLTGFQRDLLYVVAGLDDPKGLEVKDELEKVYSSEIHHDRLHPNLDTLVEKGLIDKGQLDERTNYNTPTRATGDRGPAGLGSAVSHQ